MARVVFTKILEQGRAAGMIPAKSQQAIKWFRNVATETKRVRINQALINDPNRVKLSERRTPTIGSMIHFYYEPKGIGTDSLPYWDRFPLVFPFEKRQNGFLGINMHYLPLDLRANLMDALYKVASDTNFDEDTHLKISYRLLNGVARFKEFRPCIKRYLRGHIRSKLILIDSREWDIALFLPTSRFRGARKKRVWDDSRRSLGML